MVELLTVDIFRHYFRLYVLFKKQKVANMAANVVWSHVRGFEFSASAINLV